MLYRRISIAGLPNTNSHIKKKTLAEPAMNVLPFFQLGSQAQEDLLSFILKRGEGLTAKLLLLLKELYRLEPH